MKHLLLIFTLLFTGVISSFAQDGITFTAANIEGTPGASLLDRCDGIYGIRMDDGASGGEDATSVWCNSHTIDLDRSFEIDFCIRFGSITAADGMTFTMQREGLTALERGGGYLGVTRAWNGTGAITPAVNVEFDIYNNGVGVSDIAADHVAISYNGVLNAPVEGPTAISLTNNVWSDVHVCWDACEQTLVVTMDDVEIARLTDDLVANVFSGTSTGIIFGFTSATWSSNTTHDLCFKGYRAFDCCDNIKDPTMNFVSPIPCGADGCCIGVTVTHATDASASVVYDWGDGTTSFENYHTYDSPGTYIVTVIVQYHLLDDPKNCCIKTTRKEIKVDCKEEKEDEFDDGKIKETDVQWQHNNPADLFPNPIDKGENLTLQLAEVPAATVNFTIISMEGKKIMDFQGNGSSTINIALPEDVGSGMYIITSTDENIAPQKFYVRN